LLENDNDFSMCWRQTLSGFALLYPTYGLTEKDWIPAFAGTTEYVVF
jgi:hypothetical protein